jgi:hypothetical protein
MVSIHGECSRASLIDLSAVQIECATEIGKSCDISFSRVVGKVAIFCVELLHSWRCWEMCHGSRVGWLREKRPHGPVFGRVLTVERFLTSIWLLSF